MEFTHASIMLSEVTSAFVEKTGARERFMDGTFGRGGHTREILRMIPDVQIVAVDQDRAAIDYAEHEFAPIIKAGQMKLVHANFSELAQLPDLGSFDFILLDLGVSSPQLDDPLRGFSFYQSGPLDMRMDQRAELSAADIVNSWSESDLNDLFRNLGEVRSPYRVTRAIVHDRRAEPFTTTTKLAGLIERVDGWREKGHHPATKYFLALRLEVNQELSILESALRWMMDHLRENGRLAVITFHSLEDRIVKQVFKSAAIQGATGMGRLVNKKVITPDRSEIERNPRARSAKLRVFEKGGNHEPRKYQ